MNTTKNTFEHFVLFEASYMTFFARCLSLNYMRLVLFALFLPLDGIFGSFRFECGTHPKVLTFLIF